MSVGVVVMTFFEGRSVPFRSLTLYPFPLVFFSDMNSVMSLFCAMTRTPPFRGVVKDDVCTRTFPPPILPLSWRFLRFFFGPRAAKPLHHAVAQSFSQISRRHFVLLLCVPSLGTGENLFLCPRNRLPSRTPPLAPIFLFPFRRFSPSVTFPPFLYQSLRM